MRLVLSDVDVTDNIDDEVNDVLPVVDAWWIGLLYAAGTVDYDCYVHQTRCNMRYHRTRIIHIYECKQKLNSLKRLVRTTVAMSPN